MDPANPAGVMRTQPGRPEGSVDLDEQTKDISNDVQNATECSSNASAHVQLVLIVPMHHKLICSSARHLPPLTPVNIVNLRTILQDLRPKQTWA